MVTGNVGRELSIRWRSEYGRRRHGRRGLLSVLLLALFALAGCGSPAPPPASASRPAAGASVVDAGRGVAWLMAGVRVLRTTNDGASWRTVFPTAAAPGSSQNLGAVWFLGREDAWVEQVKFPGVSRTGSTIWWHTTDGGVHWSKALAPPHMALYGGQIPFDRVSFSGPRSGFALMTKLVGTSHTVRRAESLWSTKDGGRTWSRVAARDLPGNDAEVRGGFSSVASDPFMLSAVSSGEAWLARTSGPPGLWRTTDGGRSWSPVRMPAAPDARLLGAPEFWGARGVLAVAEPAGRLVVEISDDGGASWKVASTLRTGSLTAPSGFDAISSTSWLLPSPAGLFRTLDGGRRWSLKRAGISLGGITRVAFASASSGLLVPESQIAPGALTTDNAGRSWSASPFPTTSASGKPTGSQLTAGLAASAPSVISDGSSLFFKSPRRRQWKQVLRPLSSLTGLSFANPRDGWALGASQLFMTTDAGATWSTRTEPRQGALVQAQLINREHGVGVVCGDSNAEALQTSDRGRSWRPLTLPSGAQQLLCGSALCFATAADGWALVGDLSHGKLSVLHTTDGGRRWRQQLLVNGTIEPDSIGCRRSTVWALASGSPGMSQTPSALFVSTDAGHNWIDAIATGPRPPTAVGVPPTRTEASGTEIMDVAQVEPRTLLVLSACGPCGGPGHPDGTLGLDISADGGRRWRQTASPRRPLPDLAGIGDAAIAFSSPTHGVVLAQSATNSKRLELIETTDQGRTWRRVASFPPPV